MANIITSKSTSLAKTLGGMLGRSKVKHKRYGELVERERDYNAIVPSDAYLYDMGSQTISALLGQGLRAARSRQIIYDKWASMEADAIISAAVMVLVTSALGGDKTNGDVIFIEKKPGIEKDAKKAKLVDDIKTHMEPLLNKIAVQQAYIGSCFGDAYARIYSDKSGVVEISTDELFRPPLVQPFERGCRTVGYAVFTSERNFEKLDLIQMARLKMPRTVWVPQFGIVEKSLRMHILEDDIENLPLLPSMIGGSFLYNAEEAYDRFNATLMGLVSQRWKMSLDHKIVGVQMESMTKDQQNRFMASVVDMYTKVKEAVANAIKTGQPITESITSILPMYNEKQLVSLSQGNVSTQNITVDDVMLHARILAGTLGVDLSMLGFSDQLAGNLSGDGGLSGVSAQAAERGRLVRAGVSEFCESLIDIHTLKRYGVVFPREEKPWDINFYGSIHALEQKENASRMDSMNGGMILTQAMQQMKDMGADKEIMELFLSKTMMLDEETAKAFAKIVEMKSQQQIDDEKQARAEMGMRFGQEGQDEPGGGFPPNQDDEEKP